MMIGFMLPAFMLCGLIVGFMAGLESVNFAPACENASYEYVCGEGALGFEDCVEVPNECTGHKAFEFRGLIGWEGRAALGAWIGVLVSLVAYGGSLIWLAKK